MKTYSVLYDGKCNENSDSAKAPIGEYTSQVDLEETITQCVNSGWDMLVEVKRSEVHQVSLPDWLPLKDWLRNRITYAYLWNEGAAEYPEKWQKALLGLESGFYRYELIKFLNTNPRKEFRQQLKQQIIDWLEMNPDDRKYQYPLSDKQMACIVFRYQERRTWKNNYPSDLYYHHRYNEDKGLKAA